MKLLKHSNHSLATLFIIGLLCLLPLSAFALTLQEAKSQRLVGESITGYVGVVKNASGVAELVKNINAKRQASYKKIAARNGTSLSAVEQLAAKKAIEKTAKGHMVQLTPGGAWKSK